MALQSHDCLVVQLPLLVIDHVLQLQECVSDDHDDHGYRNQTSWHSLESVITLVVDVDRLPEGVMALDEVRNAFEQISHLGLGP